MMQRYKVVCIGDSNTRGQFSFNWVHFLSKTLKKTFVFINKGSNGDLVYNAVTKIDFTICKNPDFAIILLGSNDINATLSNQNEADYIKKKKLPSKPCLSWFMNNLEQLILRLQSSTKSKIAIVSIPPMGENIYDKTNEQVREYNDKIKSLASKYHISYIPFFETLSSLLENHVTQGYGRHYVIGSSIKVKAVLKRYLLLRRWDRISDDNNLYFLTDTLHLNKRSGLVLSRLVQDFLKTK